ncbi:MAG: serine/threonine protein kinase [Myxococcales bacterium]|nr:serine/threonine protein kinase [Myxococcales bacterium]
MEPFFVLAIIFGSITAWISLRHRHRERMEQLRAEQRRQLALGPASDEVQRQLEQRIQHLETIVSGVDFELNAKLNRLATHHLQIAGQLQRAPETTLGDAPTRAVSPPIATARMGGLAIGDRLADRFLIERPLGQGGMGSVYLARDEKLGESVALKIVGGFALLDPAAADRMRHEVSVARRISHPNVVRIHDIGESAGVLFLSMEYVSGSTLADVLARYGRLPPARVREVCVQICDGLTAAHHAGIIHRDLKPSNILIDEQQRVRIIDFGIARLRDSSGMTATGTVVGTPEYMAPEQVSGRAVDARTDIYALGAVLYHALCGRPPFQAATAIATTLAQLNDPPTPPRALVPELSETWETLVLQALEKDPERRFPTAQALKARLPAP